MIEAVAQRCSVKKVFLRISQNSQENTCARVFVGLVLDGLSAHFTSMFHWPENELIKR